MKIQHPLLIRASAVRARSWSDRLWADAPTTTSAYDDPSVDPEVARRLGQRYIYAFFHEVMLFPAYYWTGRRCTS